MTDDPSWDRWRTFLAVVREGSLSGAARGLALTQPTVGRQIDALEASLGTPLFTRSPTGLVPTDLARSLVPQAAVMASAAASMQRAASGATHEVSGVVRLAASEVVGTEVLPPMLADFRVANPRVALELALSNRNEDLLRRDADLAVRMVRPEQGALVVKRVGVVQLGLFAHARYLAGCSAPTSLDALAEHAMIGYDRDLPAIAALAQAVPVPREAFAVRCDSDVGQLAALRAGLGIGVCQLPVAARDPQLVRVLPTLGFSLEVWLASHEDLRASARVRRLFDHLAATLGAYCASYPDAS